MHLHELFHRLPVGLCLHCDPSGPSMAAAARLRTAGCWDPLWGCVSAPLALAASAPPQPQGLGLLDASIPRSLWAWLGAALLASWEPAGLAPVPRTQAAWCHPTPSCLTPVYAGICKLTYELWWVNMHTHS